MQNLKYFLLACSLAVAAAPVCLHADDTDAQATARAALQQKMLEMNGQNPAAVTQPESTPPASKIKETTPPPEIQAPPMQKQAPRPVLVPAPRRSSPGQPPVAPPRYTPAPMESAKASGAPQVSLPAILVVPETSSPDLIEQARQATRAKLSEIESQRNNAAPVEPPAAPPPAFQPAAETVAPTAKAMQPVVTEVKPSKDEIRAAKEREAAEMKAAREQAEMEKAAAKKAAAEKAAADRAAAQQAKLAAEQEKAAAKAANTAAKAKPEMAPANFAPLAVPASNLPPTKEQRLQTLLDQYRSDQLTAEEYHDQRSKIIAEP